MKIYFGSSLVNESEEKKTKRQTGVNYAPSQYCAANAQNVFNANSTFCSSLFHP